MQRLHICDQIGIRASKIFACAENQSFGNWIALQRLTGEKLSTVPLNNATAKQVGEKIVESLTKFEGATMMETNRMLEVIEGIELMGGIKQLQNAT